MAIIQKANGEYPYWFKRHILPVYLPEKSSTWYSEGWLQLIKEDTGRLNKTIRRIQKDFQGGIPPHIEYNDGKHITEAEIRRRYSKVFYERQRAAIEHNEQVKEVAGEMLKKLQEEG